MESGVGVVGYHAKAQQLGTRCNFITQSRKGAKKGLVRPVILQSYFGVDARVAAPKFTNLYAKRGIFVNLPQRRDVGSPGPKAGVGFNTFKEPVAQKARD
jgi:hypothetical protein